MRLKVKQILRQALASIWLPTERRRKRNCLAVLHDLKAPELDAALDEQGIELDKAPDNRARRNALLGQLSLGDLEHTLNLHPYLTLMGRWIGVISASLLLWTLPSTVRAMVDEEHATATRGNLDVGVNTISDHLLSQDYSIGQIKEEVRRISLVGLTAIPEAGIDAIQLNMPFGSDIIATPDVTNFVASVSASDLDRQALVSATSNLRQHKWSEAEAAAKSLEGTPNPEVAALAFSAMAMAAIGLGDIDKATIAADTAARLLPLDFRVLEIAGYVFCIAEDYYRAQNALESALNAGSNSALTYSNLSGIAVGSARYAKAVELAATAIGLDEDLTLARVNMASALLFQGDASAAERHAAIAVHSDPDNCVARELLAYSLEKQGKTAEAIEELSEALECDNNSRARENYAVLLFKAGRYMESARACHGSDQHGELTAKLGRLWGQSLSRSEKFDEALLLYVRLVETFKDELAVIDWMGLLLDMNRYEELVQVAKEMSVVFPNLCDIQIKKAAAHRSLGQSDEMLSALRKAIEIDRYCEDAYHNLVVVYLTMLDDPSGAREEAQNWFRVLPESPQAGLMLAQTMLASERDEEAVGVLVHVITLPTVREGDRERAVALLTGMVSR